MKGSFHRYAPGERWRAPEGDMGLVLETDEDTVVCFFPRHLDRLRRKELATFPPLARLGPDLLAGPDLGEVTRRARDLVDPGEAIAFCLLDQRPACGIGNIYKSESLFARGLHPARTLASLEDAELRALYAAATELLVRNTTGPAPDLHARTTPPRARDRHFVYERAGRPCLRCGARISFENQRSGDLVRMTWWCPRCQPAQ
jgi:endonuclease-8